MSREYFYGSEADEFSYFRIPRLLITDEQYKGVATDAKLLYGLLLDRMGLSAKNKWFDGQGRVFIYYTINEICEDLNCAHGKAVKLLAELDDIKGVGLIERVRQGQGNPAKIYVKRFADARSTENGSQDFSKQEVKTSQKRKSRLPKNGSQDFSKTEVKTSQNQKSRLLKSGSLDFRKSASNYPEYSQPDNSYPEHSNSLPFTSFKEEPNDAKRSDGNCKKVFSEEERERYRAQLIDDLELEAVKCDNPGQAEQLDEILELLLDAICTGKDTIRVCGENKPSAVVRSRFLKLNSEHIRYVLDCLRENTTQVRNIKQYLLTALYNAPATMDSHYTVKVNHDMYSAEAQSKA